MQTRSMIKMYFKGKKTYLIKPWRGEGEEAHCVLGAWFHTTVCVV